MDINLVSTEDRCLKLAIKQNSENQKKLQSKVGIKILDCRRETAAPASELHCIYLKKVAINDFKILW